MIYQGELFTFFEQGMEGLMWALQLDGKRGYDGLFDLRENDTLTITDQHGSVVWQGIISFDKERTLVLIDPKYPEYQIKSQKYFNHGVQKDVSHLQWTHWFTKGYRGTVWRKE